MFSYLSVAKCDWIFCNDYYRRCSTLLEIRNSKCRDSLRFTRINAARLNVAVSMSMCLLAHGIVTRGRIKGTFSSVIRCTTTMFRISLHWVTRGISVLATSFCALLRSFAIASKTRGNSAGRDELSEKLGHIFRLSCNCIQLGNMVPGRIPSSAIGDYSRDIRCVFEYSTMIFQLVIVRKTGIPRVPACLNRASIRIDNRSRELIIQLRDVQTLEQSSLQVTIMQSYRDRNNKIEHASCYCCCRSELSMY